MVRVPSLPAMSALRDQMQADLRTAMKARDALRVAVLRTTLAAFANAEAVAASPTTRPALGLYAGEAERRELTDDDIHAVVAAERDELRAAAADMRAGGHDDEAAEREAKAAILDAYL